MVGRTLVDSGPSRTVVYASTSPVFQWVDIGAPDRATLSTLTADYGLPEAAILDFLDPPQLPKYERVGRGAFVILRVHLERFPSSAATTRELTETVAIFAAPGLLLTLHHRDHRAFAQLRARYAHSRIEATDDLAAVVLDDMMLTTLQTFSPPLDALLTDLTEFEGSLLRRRVTEAGLEQVFIRRRRASMLATLLRRTREVVTRLGSHPSRPDVDDSGELVDTLEYRAHELLEYTDQLINLQIAVASHRTNEVVRLLTLISVVFMPLTFIVGLYGMNFDLPEFRLAHGYLVPYVLIVGSVGAALLWFRRRGWLD